ncbi:hypothetical protein GQ42DRAFT_55251 [Ramicandelaber brevisporus]|nr:hypothetical protein GQ42DRAFT_55251 [Ramicandelaber brevisporus]
MSKTPPPPSSPVLGKPLEQAPAQASVSQPANNVSPTSLAANVDLNDETMYYPAEGSMLKTGGIDGQPAVTTGFSAMQQPGTNKYGESFGFGNRVNQSSYVGIGGQSSVFGNSILSSGSKISEIVTNAEFMSAEVDDDLLNIKVVRDRVMIGTNVEMLDEAEHRLLYSIFGKKCSKEVLDKIKQHWNNGMPDFPQFIDDIWELNNLDLVLENAKETIADRAPCIWTSGTQPANVTRFFRSEYHRLSVPSDNSKPVWQYGCKYFSGNSHLIKSLASPTIAAKVATYAPDPVTGKKKTALDVSLETILPHLENAMNARLAQQEINKAQTITSSATSNQQTSQTFAFAVNTTSRAPAVVPARAQHATQWRSAAPANVSTSNTSVTHAPYNPYVKRADIPRSDTSHMRIDRSEFKLVDGYCTALVGNIPIWFLKQAFGDVDDVTKMTATASCQKCDGGVLRFLHCSMCMRAYSLWSKLVVGRNNGTYKPTQYTSNYAPTAVPVDPSQMAHRRQEAPGNSTASPQHFHQA